ncbi:MAG: hypothetical protein F6K22_22635 [Okeania sp. SIO2F4]|uniref:hypothetical protein n=1 Tax=Okeania sp. SIO2F4 TaxID=2607790 RepID=UPI00142D0B74|nr:hypothetical protein [Okeania sp. SIO2F4]NES05370.1 hypothetical protein [Okeania sp. SIO2F4]
MVSIPDLEKNLAKMQQLLNAAQNEVQKKTFQDIIENITKQLEQEKSKLNPTKAEDLKVDKPSDKETTFQSIQQSKTETKKQTESNPKSESQKVASSEVKEEESLPPKQDYAFQGIGILYGKIVRRYEDNDAYYNLISEGKTYGLIYNSPKVKEFLRLDYNPDKDRYVTVYPYLTHFPNKNTPPKLAFTIIAANDTPHLDLKVNEFKLSGLWQFIAVCKCPVISIHRNRKGKDDRVSRLKKKFDNEKLNKKLTRANHVPVLWRDALVKPFRFNPKLEKDQQGSRYFVEIKAKFLPGREQWGFMELFGEPTLDVPKYYKPEKISNSQVA